MTDMYQVNDQLPKARILEFKRPGTKRTSKRLGLLKCRINGSWKGFSNLKVLKNKTL